jgi:predicted phage terminase large subunit-like protein
VKLTDYVLGNPEHGSRILQPRLNKYIPHEPTVKQRAFLLLDEIDDAFYGGAGGGGKSDALLMAALQYVDVPGYAAILFRRTITDLTLEGALIPRSLEWLGNTDAVWNAQKHKWAFPSGATLSFGYLETERDKYRYAGSEYQYIGFDELTQFSESQFRFLFSRLRRKVGVPIPLRMRGASNPGSVGHVWVKQRYIVGGVEHGRVFIPATLRDNPHIDQGAYRRSLSHLDPITRAHIEEGNWDAEAGGSMFDRSWFPIRAARPADVERRIRYWDLASSTSESAKYTAGVRMALTSKEQFAIEHVVRGKWRPGERDEVILQTAHMDGVDTIIYIEQEPGSGGDAQVQYLIRKLSGYAVERHLPRGDKTTRAAPLASQAEAGNVFLLEGPWNGDFIDEVQAFPDGEYKDQVDACSGAFAQLAGGRYNISVA